MVQNSATRRRPEKRLHERVKGCGCESKEQNIEQNIPQGKKKGKKKKKSSTKVHKETRTIPRGVPWTSSLVFFAARSCGSMSSLAGCGAVSSSPAVQ